MNSKVSQKMILAMLSMHYKSHLCLLFSLKQLRGRSETKFNCAQEDAHYLFVPICHCRTNSGTMGELIETLDAHGRVSLISCDGSLCSLKWSRFVWLSCKRESNGRMGGGGCLWRQAALMKAIWRPVPAWSPAAD